MEPAKARPPRQAARRSRDGALARSNLAGHHKGAQAQGHRICFIDESGVSPRPRVVRTDAPVGQTPILRECWTRDQLSALAAISPEGKRSFRSQDRAINSADVVGFLAHLRREVPGHMVRIWDGAPIPRRHTRREFLTTGVSPRLHEECLPAYAPELNPGEGLWAHLISRLGAGADGAFGDRDGKNGRGLFALYAGSRRPHPL